MLCGIIGGVFLIAAGIKYRKSLTIIAGLVCLLLIIVPIIISIGIGIDVEKQIPISATVYWSLFPLAGLLAIVSGRQITSIRSMGTIMFITGFFMVIAYQLLVMT